MKLFQKGVSVVKRQQGQGVLMIPLEVVFFDLSPEGGAADAKLTGRVHPAAALLLQDLPNELLLR